jgi:hypothetical protein
MKKIFSIVALTLVMAGNLNAKSTETVIETYPCIDEARAIAFHYMANHGLSEDQGAELVLLLIQGC